MKKNGNGKKITKIRGKEFKIFEKTIKTLSMTAQDNGSGKDNGNIPIRLSLGIAEKDPVFLPPYAQSLLAIHGIENDTDDKIINEKTIIAFGKINDEKPTGAARIACFRNPEVIINNLRIL